MAFEPIRANRGQPRVRGICDHCGRDDVVRAVHGKSGRDGFGQAAQKLQGMGWTYIGKSLRCPNCEAKRKVDAMVKVDAKKAVGASPVRQPTRAQKREIMDLLDDVYDTGAECYRRGDTDETVADVLGVMPGWVCHLREEFYGPAGHNEDMAALRSEVSEFLKASEVIVVDLKSRLDALNTERDRARGFLERLGKIESAVGSRIMARVAK